MRYLVFAGYDYPNIYGWQNFSDGFANSDEALAYAQECVTVGEPYADRNVFSGALVTSRKECDWAHVADVQTRSIVAEYRRTEPECLSRAQ